MHIRYPVWLHRVAAPGAHAFAFMFALESLARASLATVIPLQALAIVGDARDVSLLFTSVGVLGLAASFAIPLLIRRLRRRWIYSLGAVLLAAAAVLFETMTLTGQLLGMLIRVFATACLNISLSLYVMDYIRKRDFVRAEPLRLQFSAAAWTIGPVLGVVLYEHFGSWAAYGFSGACAMTLLVYFWFLRAQENPVVAAATRAPPNPLKSVHRFFVQPRLRLAWLIAFGRSSWWVFFFIYVPVFMVQSGHAATTGALVVSAGNAMLFLTPAFGRLGAEYGIRRVLSGAFVTAGAATLVAVVFFDHALLAAQILVFAALSTVALDALGGIPFLRSVRSYERPQMTTVYRTYADTSDLLLPALSASLLTYFDLKAVFVAAGLLTVGVAFWARYLPRRM